jgi:hypothetical protein
MVTRSHTRARLSKLRLMADKFVQLTFDKTLRAQMRSLWGRKKVTDPNLESLGDFYEQAFEEYLFEVKVPKQIVKITRESARLKVSEKVPEQLQQMQKIAIKRQQPLAVVIEEALQRYLDKPENYLGKGHNVKERLERLG